jgi:hypothetical protein
MSKSDQPSTVGALFAMWSRPRLVAWFFISMLLGIVVRLPFIRLQILPNYLDFHPGFVLVPLGGVFFGPAGAWGALAASVLGDKLLGQWSALALFRGLGFFFAAWSTQKLWDFSFHGDDAPVPAATWSHTLRFIVATWPGSCIAAAWTAFGSEVLRLYPFTYVVSLLMLNNMLYSTILGLPLYRIMAREWNQHFGTWRDALPAAGRPPGTSLINALLIFCGGIGACLAGIYAGNLFYGVSLLQPFVLGSYTGKFVPFLVLPFLLSQLGGLFRRR